MRVTICEIPHEPGALSRAWCDLCRHTQEQGTELLLLPECAMVEPFWQLEQFEPARWEAVRALSAAWIERLGETGATHVVGTRPVTLGDQRFNEGFLWSRQDGVIPLRRKYFLPEEPGWWERRWFDRGDSAFEVYRTGELAFGLNICTELWAVESFAAYAACRAPLILTPRATGAATISSWLAVGTVAAMRSGAYSLSSNRWDGRGGGGGMGWIISPEGEVLALTTQQAPFATRELELALAGAGNGYPGYVFADAGGEEEKLARVPGV